MIPGTKVAVFWHVPKKRDTHFDYPKPPPEDPDLTAASKGVFTRSEAELAQTARRGTLPTGQPILADVPPEVRAGDVIPPVPTATPIPGHYDPERHKPAPRRQPRRGSDEIAGESQPRVIQGEKREEPEVPPERMPSSGAARRTWPMALLAGALAAPALALRVGMDALSRVRRGVDRLTTPWREKGERVFREWVGERHLLGPRKLRRT